MILHCNISFYIVILFPPSCPYIALDLQLKVWMMVWSRMQVARKDSLYVVQKRDDINAKIIALQVQSNMFALLAQFPYIFMLVLPIFSRCN